MGSWFGTVTATNPRQPEQRQRFLLKVEPIGVFTALDVPDRMGPTWSRRTGG